MAFTVEDFHDLLKLLHERPEWRDELRRVLFPDFAEMIASIERLSTSVNALESQVSAFIGQINTRMDRVEENLGRLNTRMDRVEGNLDQISTHMDRVEGDVGTLKGWQLEELYRRRASAYFSRIARRVIVPSAQELTNLLEDAVTDGQLSRIEFDEIIQADLIARGVDGENTPIYLLAEISWGIGTSDVARAARRASLLAKLGAKVIPIAAGKWITAEAREGAAVEGVWLVTNGSTIPPASDT
ncbi:MAG: hypothetical protein KF893_06665 [Caldilineaceae bacterium]|nr:hypothetical protein [Caldilineaceae bacterium]